MKYIKCKETKINKESEHSDHCEDEGKINGLLYLPALGIISNFVGGILALYMLSSFSINIFKSFGTITTQGFFLLLLMMINIIITSIAAFIFFNKRKSVKKNGYLLPFWGVVCHIFSDLAKSAVWLKLHKSGSANTSF